MVLLRLLLFFGGGLVFMSHQLFLTDVFGGFMLAEIKILSLNVKWSSRTLGDALIQLTQLVNELFNDLCRLIVRTRCMTSFR